MGGGHSGAVYLHDPADFLTQAGADARYLQPAQGNAAYVAIDDAPVSPYRYGAVGDGVADDLTAIQDALNAAGQAATSGYRGAAVQLAGRFAHTGTLSLPSGVTLKGTGKADQLIHLSGAVPAVASAVYLAGGTPAPTGRAEVRDLTMVPAGFAGEHAIVLCDFYSVIDNVDMGAFGGDGVHLTHKNSAGTPVAGTLVNNRVSNVAARLCAGTPVYLGDDSNGALTDGWLENIEADLSGTSPNGVYLGAAAGWNIKGIHCAGGASGSPVVISRVFYTVVKGIYIETIVAGNQGITFANLQDGLYAAGIHCLMPNGANAAAVTMSGDGSVTNPGAVISGLIVRQDNAVTTYGVQSFSAITTRVYGLVPTGTNKASVANTTGSGAGSITVV